MSIEQFLWDKANDVRLHTFARAQALTILYRIKLRELRDNAVNN